MVKRNMAVELQSRSVFSVLWISRAIKHETRKVLQAPLKRNKGFLIWIRISNNRLEYIMPPQIIMGIIYRHHQRHRLVFIVPVLDILRRTGHVLTEVSS